MEQPHPLVCRHSRNHTLLYYEQSEDIPASKLMKLIVNLRDRFKIGNKAVPLQGGKQPLRERIGSQATSFAKSRPSAK
jgi:hypothetical protein